ncbi:Zinc finger protein 93 [Anthophora quadrimaculata]
MKDSLTESISLRRFTFYEVTLLERMHISHIDTHYPCFREPVAGQQRNPDRNSSCHLTAVDSRKRENDETPGRRCEQLLSTSLKYSEPEEPQEESQRHTLLESDRYFKRNPKKPETDSQNTSSRKLVEPDGVKKDEAEVDQVLDKIKNTCPFCEKRFDNAKKVENHVTYVHRKPYKCDMCKRGCHTARALEEHKMIHRPDYFFECEICHVKYKSEDSLKRHNMRTHSDYESKYVCEHCGRSYKLKIDLTHHMKRTHVSELQICRFCGKEVKDVKGHEWRHQKRNKEVKYEHTCHLCRKKFHHRSRLDNHLRLHEKGFKCEECGKEYRGTRELMSHKRFKHGQAKISTCILCQKAFPSSSNFYQHVLTHAGIRPYKCDVCEEDFTQRSSLLRHRRHHPGPLPPLHSTHPQIAELARSYLQKLQSDQIDKSYVLNARL